MLADGKELARISGDRRLAAQLVAIRDIAFELLRSDDVGPLLSNSHSLIRHLCAEMGHLRTETLRVIFLDARNRLILDEVMWQGSMSEVAIHTREVMRRALQLDASALIIAHNHPSGVLVPSPSDIELTKEMLAAARSLDLTLHDHLLIAPGGALSLRFGGFDEVWH